MHYVPYVLPHQNLFTATLKSEASAQGYAQDLASILRSLGLASDQITTPFCKAGPQKLEILLLTCEDMHGMLTSMKH